MRGIGCKARDTERSGSVRNTSATGNRKSESDSNPRGVYVSQIAVSLEVDYLLVYQLTSPSRTQLSVFCHYPEGGPRYRMVAACRGHHSHTQRQEAKRRATASLWKILFSGKYSPF